MLVVEMLVLIFVGYEVGVTIKHQIQAHYRGKKICNITADLRGLIVQGEEVRRLVPTGPHGAYDPDWVGAVRSWTESVETYIGGLSAKSLAEFRRIRLDDAHRLLISDFGWQEITGSSAMEFQRLNARLDNLHRITQNCEDYF